MNNDSWIFLYALNTCYSFSLPSFTNYNHRHTIDRAGGNGCPYLTLELRNRSQSFTMKHDGSCRFSTDDLYHSLPDILRTLVWNRCWIFFFKYFFLYFVICAKLTTLALLDSQTHLLSLMMPKGSPVPPSVLWPGDTSRSRTIIGLNPLVSPPPPIHHHLLPHGPHLDTAPS